MLDALNLSCARGDRTLFRGLALTLPPGELLHITGANGSGKTTLLRCVSGQITPVAGSVSIDGLSILKAPHSAKRVLGYAHPPEALPGLLTGRQCLEVYAAAHDLVDIGSGILDLAAELRLAPLLDQWVAGYSLGTRQKLSILLALIGDPALVVLDEAFNGLDPASALVLRRALQERVASRRCAVLLATHALDAVVRHATRAGLLLEGELVRTWDRDQLHAMRDEPGALEAALAQAARECTA